MGTIRVTGKGLLRVKPDTTRIGLSLEGVYPEYGEALRRSSEETKSLRELLADFGFSGSDLKTLSFGVDAEYEGYQEEGVYRQRFLGYRFRHALKLEFPSDNERLGKVLYALSSGPVRPELSLSYTVRDPEAAKNELLGRAVADAGAKAEVLARAAGVRLGSIQSIDYAWGRMDLEVRPADRIMAARAANGVSKLAGSYALDVEPEDIEVSDTVTVLWEIG